MMAEIYKKKEDENYVSPHAEYLASLPGNADDFPVCFSEEEISLLEGS